MLVPMDIKAGSKRNIVPIFFRTLILAADTESAAGIITGLGKAAVAYNTATLTAYYKRQGEAAATAITLAAGTIGTFVSGGLILVDDTNAPGLCEFGIPDTVVRKGAKWATISFKGITGVEEITLLLNLARSIAY